MLKRNSQQASNLRHTHRTENRTYGFFATYFQHKNSNVSIVQQIIIKINLVASENKVKQIRITSEDHNSLFCLVTVLGLREY